MMYSARCFRCFCENPELCGAKRRFFAVSVHHLLRFSRRLNCNRLQNNTGGTDLEEIGKEQINERIPRHTGENLYKVYRVGETKVYALNGVDFTMYKGEFCAIVGTSGSGNPHFKYACRPWKPTKGEIVIAGKHIEKLNENQLVSFRRERVGFIFQSYNLLNTMNAVENIALPLSFQGIPKKKTDRQGPKISGISGP